MPWTANAITPAEIFWKGTLTGYAVKCPRHGSEYDIRNGKVLKGPVKKELEEKTHPVTVEGDDIFVDAYSLRKDLVSREILEVDWARFELAASTMPR